MSEKYNADLAKCLEELSKSITEFENLKCRLSDDIRWFKQRLEDNTVSAAIADIEPMDEADRAKCEQDLAEATALNVFVSDMTKSILSHSIAISDKLLNKEGE